jgi:hypothetical protein
LSACGSATTSTGVYLEGITIPASTLTTGFGCGTGPGQVYKYAAVIVDPPTGAVYDCYASAAFQNLPTQADGGDNYTIDVFLYDEPTYNANSAQINAAVGAANGAATLAKIQSTYQTVCTGSQTLNLQSVALCSSISVAPGSLQITTTSFPLADGGTLACNAGFNVVYDGAFDGGTFVPEAGTVSAFCPNPITLGPFPANTQASTPITLFQNATRVGSTTCRGTVFSSNAASPATCDPLE